MELITIIIIIAIVIFVLFVGYSLGKKIGHDNASHEFSKEIPSIRKDAASRSRAVVTGLVSEQLAPYFPDFPYNPNEVRFIGKPIDFLVFKGMDEKEISEIVFVEVKSGKSTLSSIERKVKEAIEKGRVRWEEYRVKG